MPSTEKRNRIVSIDVLRGVAVLGILLVNIVSMGLPFAAHNDPTIAGNRSPADFWAWAIASVAAEGRMRAIFSMLFGASVILLSARIEARSEARNGARAEADSAADIHLRRNLWLMVFGTLHSVWLLWPGDILFTYGAAGLPLFVFRRLRPRTLILLGAIVLALQIPRAVYHNMDLAEASAGLRTLSSMSASGRALTSEEQKSRARWRETLAEDKPTTESLQETIDDHRSGYLSNLGRAASATVYLESQYLYTTGLWDAVGPMLIGMAFLKMGVLSAARSLRFYAVMTLAGYAIGIPLSAWAAADWMRHGFEAGARWVSLDDVTRVSVALGHVGVVMMVCKAGVLPLITRPLADIGRMALTNYVLQTIICTTLFTGSGLGWFGQLARHQLYYIVLSVWAVEWIASTVWLRRFRFGPLEWIWRWLSYRQRPPMKV
jgi:uncharacterized protein